MSFRDALNLPSSEITDESVYRDRRRLLQLLALTPALGVAGCAEADPPPPPKTVVTPAQARSGFRTAEELTRLEDVTSYNNFYEFGTDKTDPSKAAKTLKLSPWTVKVGGECEKPGSLSLDELLKGIASEERIYRLRCVEGWSMVILWTGVPLGEVPALRADLQGEVRGIHHPGRPATDAGRALPFDQLAISRRLAHRRGDASADPAGHRPVRQAAAAAERRAAAAGGAVEVRLQEHQIDRGNPFRRKMPETAWHDLQPSEYGFFSTSIQRWTTRAGARRPNAASPAPPASCLPNASRQSPSTGMPIRSLRCMRAWI